MPAIKAAQDKSRLFQVMIMTVLLVLLSSVICATASSEPVQHHEVVISGFAFVPKVLAVSPGDIVTWVNKDVVPHNVVISSNHKAISPDLESGDTFAFVVTEAMAYECGFHPSMTAELAF